MKDIIEPINSIPAPLWDLICALINGLLGFSTAKGINAALRWKALVVRQNRLNLILSKIAPNLKEFIPELRENGVARRAIVNHDEAIALKILCSEGVIGCQTPELLRVGGAPLIYVLDDGFSALAVFAPKGH